MQKALEMADGKSSSFHTEWVFRHLVERQGAKVGDSILDFGAGSGSLLRKLASEGFLCLHGMDLLPSPSLSGVEWHRSDLNESPRKVGDQFHDWVTCVEVIEHLENPRQVLRRIHSLLKPNGTVILTTPNVESLRSLISFCLRGHFVDFLASSYPAHITPVVLMDLKRILAELNFSVLHTEYSNRGAVPSLTHFGWQALGLGGKRFSDHLLIVARKNS